MYSWYVIFCTGNVGLGTWLVVASVVFVSVFVFCKLSFLVCLLYLSQADVKRVYLLYIAFDWMPNSSRIPLAERACLDRVSSTDVLKRTRVLEQWLQKHCVCVSVCVCLSVSLCVCVSTQISIGDKPLVLSQHICEAADVIVMTVNLSSQTNTPFYLFCILFFCVCVLFQD